MCGIFGILANSLPKATVIKRALDSIGHRGPDDEGYVFLRTSEQGFVQASGQDTVSELKNRLKDVSDVDACSYNLVLGNRRLAILDLSSRGHQPMSCADGALWITYNGEIFNYWDLKRELEALGHDFRSGADTEVVLAAYSQWGEDCLSRFNGQWAFCIYDARAGKLFCSRDRFGIKPFYYWFDGENFAFASEIKSLLGLPFVKRELNRSLIADFLFFNEHHHKSESLYVGISQLMPAGKLTVDLREMKIGTETYYSLPYYCGMGRYSRAQAARYADDIREILIDSVKIRLISNVPVGSCLSGGLDSSSIVVIINRLLREGGICSDVVGDAQKTFTVSFDDPRIDEKRFAEEVIRRTGVKGYFIYPTAEKFWQEAGDFLFHQDGLCFMTNVYGSWEAMRLASAHVKVVLNGQGGDELFGGYSRYEDVYLADMLREKRLVEFLSYFFRKSRLNGLIGGCKRALMGLYIASVPDKLKGSIFSRRNSARFDLISGLLGAYYPADEGVSRMIERVKSLNRQLRSEYTTDYLPQLLHYDDRNASAFSIENRVPFVDHRLAEYVSGIPAVYKYHDGWSKWLLRMAMRELLPEKILWRRDKIGFSTPEERWMSDASSPVAPLVERHRLEEFGKHFIWKFHAVERLISAETQ